jgi:dipeptide/tripeptide permease
MSNAMFLNLASIEAVRPVFMIVMGVFLMVVAWRIARETHGWSARLTFGGAFLLCLGYAILVPMYEAGKIEKFHPSLHLHNPAAAMGWHAVKLVVMNVGWLLFGLGVGLHSGLLRMPAVFKISKIEPLPSHEPVA